VLVQNPKDDDPRPVVHLQQVVCRCVTLCVMLCVTLCVMLCVQPPFDSNMSSFIWILIQSLLLNKATFGFVASLNQTFCRKNTWRSCCSQDYLTLTKNPWRTCVLLPISSAYLYKSVDYQIHLALICLSSLLFFREFDLQIKLRKYTIFTVGNTLSTSNEDEECVVEYEPYKDATSCGLHRGWSINSSLLEVSLRC